MDGATGLQIGINIHMYIVLQSTKEWLFVISDIIKTIIIAVKYKSH